jgi:hypothetical protein
MSFMYDEYPPFSYWIVLKRSFAWLGGYALLGIDMSSIIHYGWVSVELGG